MTQPGLIVVGSGPAGVAAAEAFRHHNPSLPVTIMTADRDVPYERPPLSKEYLRGQSEGVELHPASWYAEHGIDIDYSSVVTAVDPGEHTVSTGRTSHPYRTLVLACGARPRGLPVAGGELAYSLRSRHDAQLLRAGIAGAESAVVVGAGFIGCEAAASLAAQGIAVTVIAPDPVPQAARLGEAAGHQLLGLLEGSGIHYRGGVRVQAVSAGTVHFDGGTVQADLILAATGVTPNCELAEAAGIAVEASRVKTGAGMATSAPDVFAAGDVALAYNASAGRALAVEHWQDATDQGTIAGTSAAGEDAAWTAVPGFWSTIGGTTINYHGWGDGFDHCRMVQRDNGFTVWYEADGAVVGVLTCNADDDDELGEHLILARRPAPVAMR